MMHILLGGAIMPATSAATTKDARIRLQFDVERPVELVDLTLAFTSFARQYRKFTRARMALRGAPIADEDAHLYITRIESNCIFAELAPGSDLLGASMVLFDYINILIDFTKHIDQAIRYLGNRQLERPSIDGMDCNDIHDFVELIAKNKDGALNLEVAEIDKKRDQTLIKLTFHQPEALAAQRGAIEEKHELSKRGYADRRGVILRWYQTNIGRAKADGRTGDRAIIDDVLPDRHLPTYFVSEIDQSKMAMLDDPYNHLYVVDVNVAHVQGVPKSYTIVRLRDVLDRNGD